MYLIKTGSIKKCDMVLEISDGNFLFEIEKSLNEKKLRYLNWSKNEILVSISKGKKEVKELLDIVDEWNMITFQCECGKFEYNDNKGQYECACGLLRCEECYNDDTEGVNGEVYCNDCVDIINDSVLGDLI